MLEDDIRKQLEASSRMRRENAHCSKHKEYKCEVPPIIDCYLCWHAYNDRHQTEESIQLLHEAMDKFGGLVD